MRILLVDDSKTMRNIQRLALAKLGYTDIEEAKDGLDALSKVDAFNPELILLDWNMPIMDGLTFVQTYRAKGKTVPIIMVTTEAEKSRVVDAIKAGVNSYVVKPFTQESFSQRVIETIGRISKAA